MTMIAPHQTPPWKVGLFFAVPFLVGVGLTWIVPRDSCRARVPARAAPVSPISPIRCSGNHCTIERRRVAAILAQPASLGSKVKVVPSVIDWRGTNYYLFGVRPGSAAARLGLRDGDRIVRVNGRQFRYPEDALRQYLEVKHADRVTLDVYRNASVVHFDYEIR